MKVSVWMLICICAAQFFIVSLSFAEVGNQPAANANTGTAPVLVGTEPAQATAKAELAPATITSITSLGDGVSTVLSIWTTKQVMFLNYRTYDKPSRWVIEILNAIPAAELVSPGSRQGTIRGLNVLHDKVGNIDLSRIVFDLAQDNLAPVVTGQTSSGLQVSFVAVAPGTGSDISAAKAVDIERAATSAEAERTVRAAEAERAAKAAMIAEEERKVRINEEGKKQDNEENTMSGKESAVDTVPVNARDEAWLGSKELFRLVRVQGDATGGRIVLQGAEPEFRWFMWNHKRRLVVDLKRAKSALRSHRFNVDSPNVQRVRVGLHPNDRVRVVFDLKAKPKSVDVKRDGQELKVDMLFDK